MVSDAKTARLGAHRKNIRRYRDLLKTQLTDFERRYIERRLSEELSVLRNYRVAADGEYSGG